MRRPTWLTELRNGRLAGGKRKADTSGAAQPSSEGPRKMPAAISPTTCGWWRSLRKTRPTARAAIRMTPICRMRRRRSNFTGSSSPLRGRWAPFGAQAGGRTAGAAASLEGADEAGLEPGLVEARLEGQRLIARAGAGGAAAPDARAVDLDRQP